MVISGIYKAAVLGSQAMDWDGITPPEQLPSTTAELLTSPLQSLHEQRELYAHHAERAQGALAQFERLAAAAQPAGAAAPELRALAAQLRALRALVERLEQQRPPAAGPPPKRRAEAAAGGGGGRKRGRKGAAAKPAEAPAAPPPAAAPAAEAPSDAAGSGAASRAQLVSTLPIDVLEVPVAASGAVATPPLPLYEPAAGVAGAADENAGAGAGGGADTRAPRPWIKKPWTPDQDRRLTEAIGNLGAQSWSSVAALIEGKSGKQCRERWINHINPAIRREPWSAAEDMALIQAHARIGNKWTELAALFPGRTDNAIKNRWNSTIQRKVREESAFAELAQVAAEEAAALGGQGSAAAAGTAAALVAAALAAQ